MSEPRKCFDVKAYKNAVAHMKDAGFEDAWLDKLNISRAQCSNPSKPGESIENKWPR